MKAWDYECVGYKGNIYCIECLPNGVNTQSGEVAPIFECSEWDSYPVCCQCGAEHDYVGLIECNMFLGGCVMAKELINRTACKEFAVKYAQEYRRGWSPTRCSKQFLDDVNSHLMLAVQKSIMMHRSVGKTILDFH